MGYCFKRKIRIAIKSIDGPWNCLEQLSYWIDSSLLCSLLCSAILGSVQLKRHWRKKCSVFLWVCYFIDSIRKCNVPTQILFHSVQFENIQNTQRAAEAVARNCEILSRFDRPTDRTTQYILVCTNFNCFADSIFLFVDFSLSIYIAIECNSVFVLNVCVRKLIIYYTGSNWL